MASSLSVVSVPDDELDGREGDDALSSPTEQNWQPSASTILLLRMADEDYLDDTELKALLEQLPPGWDVERAQQALQEYLTMVEAEQMGLPESKARRTLLQISMAAQGYLDAQELALLQTDLPGDWTVDSCVDAMASPDLREQLCTDLGLPPESPPAAAAEGSGRASADKASKQRKGGRNSVMSRLFGRAPSAPAVAAASASPVCEDPSPCEEGSVSTWSPSSPHRKSLLVKIFSSKARVK
jgi:hypothetical protein